MMVSQSSCSNGFGCLVRLVIVVALTATLSAPVKAQSCFIRTPAQATAAMGDRIPPSWYGYPINDPNPTSYYGGENYRQYYAYGRGYGFAGFPGPMPARCLIPDRRYLYTSYPETGEIYVRSGPPGVPPGPAQAAAGGSIKVDLPADATLWIEGAKAAQTGQERTFVLPPLAAGKTYLYQIRARWTENGKQQEETRVVTVQTGSQVHVKFPLDLPGKLPALVAEEGLSGKR
jgi:uncharacterized protein (TIGR03000 family)